MWDKKGEDIVFKWLYSLKEQVEETPAEAEPKPQEFTGQTSVVAPASTLTTS